MALDFDNENYDKDFKDSLKFYKIKKWFVVGDIFKIERLWLWILKITNMIQSLKIL